MLPLFIRKIFLMNLGITCLLHFLHSAGHAVTSSSCCWQPEGTPCPSPVPPTQTLQHPDTLAPEASACQNQTQASPHLKCQDSQFQSWAFIPRPRFEARPVRTLLSWPQRDVDRLALPLLSWRKPQSATQAAVSAPLLPICVVSAASRWELCCTQAGQPATAFLFPVFSQGINVPGKGTTVPPPPGVSSFTTATWLHHPVLSFLWPLARMQLLNTITGWCTKQTAPRTLGSDLTGFVETKDSHQGQHVYLGMVLSDWSQIYLFPSLPCPAWVTSSCRILRNDCLGDVGGQRLL